MTRRNRPEDVWSRVDVQGPDGCWLWTGGLTRNGYGVFYLAGTKTVAHRVAYEVAVGPIPDGLQLDHLCRNRRCCNPRHLEPVTCTENIERSPLHNRAKAQCPQGHPYSGVNLYIRPSDGARMCRACKRRPKNPDTGTHRVGGRRPTASLTTTNLH